MKKILFFTFIFAALGPLQNASAQQKKFTTTVSAETKMNYLLYQPENVSGEAPLLVFLHGGGESGNNIEAVKKHGPPMLVENGKKFPFYILSPQNPYEKGFWDDRAVYNLMQKIIREYPIDTKRIYLAGLSRGGYGAWRLAMNYPDQFAAMVTICAASAPANYANWVKEIPVWIFHGEKDKVVPVSESIEMANALKQAGAEVKLTLYPEAGHDAWTETFNNEKLVDWLLRYKRR